MSTAETEYLLRRTEPWLGKLLTTLRANVGTGTAEEVQERALLRAELICDMARIRRALSEQALPIHRHD